MNLKEMTKICEILKSTVSERKHFDFQHDIIYLPYEEQDTEISKQLEEVDCFWDEDAQSWAHY